MSTIKGYIAGAVRQEILELQKLLCLLEDNSHMGKTQEFDYGVTVLRSVESRLRLIRDQLKSHNLQK